MVASIELVPNVYQPSLDNPVDLSQLEKNGFHIKHVLLSFTEHV